MCEIEYHTIEINCCDQFISMPWLDYILFYKIVNNQGEVDF